MIIYKEAFDKLINLSNSKLKASISDSLGRIFPNKLIEQTLLFDIALNLPNLNFKYPLELYETRGMAYLRCEIPTECKLSFFDRYRICLYECDIYRENDQNIAVMHFGINSNEITNAELIYVNNKFYSFQDFALHSVLDRITPKIDELNIFKLADYIYKNWEVFKDNIFVDSWMEYPNDWETYSKNKIALMLNHILKSE